jgi:hypothetical protein
MMLMHASLAATTVSAGPRVVWVPLLSYGRVFVVAHWSGPAVAVPIGGRRSGAGRFESNARVNHHTVRR